MSNKIKNPICAVIQATYQSSIFPGKSITKIAEKTVLEHIVSRIKQVKLVSEIILATSDNSNDDSLSDEAKRLNIKVFRGSEFDLISRLYNAVQHYNGNTILKVNGNYPLFDPYLANDLIDKHLKGGFDFSYNEHLKGTIYGTGCDIIQKEVLFQVNKKKITPEQRGSGILYFHQNEKDFKVNRYVFKNPRPHYKVCLDTERDLKLLEFIFKNLNHPYTDEIIKLFDNNPLLAESNRYESIKEVGIEKFFLFPEKIGGMMRNVNCSELDTAYPVSIELSLTNRCNFDCVWCSDKNLRARIRDDMSFDVIKKLLWDLKSGGTKGIVIEGGGEPTLHKNFNDVVNFAYNCGFGVGLITNGSVPLKRDIVDKFEWIRVSLDASNSEEQKKLKKRDGFEKIMSNIKSFCSSKATIGVGYVVTSKNIGSLDSLILRLCDFGVSYIQFRPVVDHPQLETNIDLSYLKRYENSKFSIITDGMDENIVTGNGGLPCTAHSLSTVITSDGSIFLCGRLNIYEWFEPIGNINKESFTDTWHGERRLKQSKMVLDSDFCKKFCPRCRLTKFNQLFARLDRIRTRNFI